MVEDRHFRHEGFADSRLQHDFPEADGVRHGGGEQGGKCDNAGQLAGHDASRKLFFVLLRKISLCS
ncbi:hypothetical protein SDC9_209079 [bioreactor metagenome]|uniref:Uncharacterized protein n=1 Tax=bioreactor metagenome TaxID=1076179 RepID=A0A645JP27_9ZZZZ